MKQRPLSGNEGFCISKDSEHISFMHCISEEAYVCLDLEM